MNTALGNLRGLFAQISLRSKLMISMLAAVMFISVIIAFVARWILVSSLTDELELRGSAIAHSVADRGASYILDNNIPQLLTLIFDEVSLHERRHLISYIFITDRNEAVLAHTMTHRLPVALLEHTLPEGSDESLRLVSADGRDVYDIAVPIKEGLYRIGTVHVGLSKDHIDNLVSKLRFAFLGFISGVIVITLYLSSQLTRRITRPVTDLTRMADEVSRGNFDIPVSVDSEGVASSDCPAFNDTDLPCWHLDQYASETPDDANLHRTCNRCAFYSSADGDEVQQLTNSFRSMIWSIRLYRHRLRESEEKYRSLFDSGPDPVFVIDARNGTVLDANPRAEELYGYGRGELLGLDFDRLTAETDLAFVDYFDQAGEPGCVYFPKSIHAKKTGDPFFVNMHACPISYRGRPAIIIAATDITAMIEKDAQLIQAAKMKTLGEMSAGVAHELNQPLNTIKMGTEYLRMMEEGVDIPQERLMDVLTDISGQVDRASEIIDTLRSFGRKAEMITEKVDLNGTIGAVLSILRRQFELDNIRFELNLSDEPVHVNAHANRLQQVFFNLVTNARDAINEHCSPQGPESMRVISIATFRLDGHAVAEVCDTGVGIAPDMLEKIFEPFFTTKETGQGMGLGLAITYGIVADYGGEMQISSRVGEGSRFRLSFPAI